MAVKHIYTPYSMSWAELKLRTELNVKRENMIQSKYEGFRGTM